MNERKLLISLLVAIPALAVGGTTVVDSITQETPPGSIGTSQVIIIRSDDKGNTSTINIGSPGGVTVIGKPRPCKPDAPTAGMGCSGKKLGAVKWSGKRLTGGFFDDAQLRDADLGHADLTNASFIGAKLENANLAGARLSNCEMTGAHLSGADLSSTDLTNCDFTGADLRNTKIGRARLVNTDFTGADLREADLNGARLINTEFEGARLDGARWVDGTRCAKGSIGACRR